MKSTYGQYVKSTKNVTLREKSLLLHLCRHTSSGFLQLKTFYVPYFWNYSVILRPIMLMKRIIPCLDIKDGRTVKGVNFEGLVDAGDPVELARRYVRRGPMKSTFSI